MTTATDYLKLKKAKFCFVLETDATCVVVGQIQKVSTIAFEAANKSCLLSMFLAQTFRDLERSGYFEVDT